jgi:hypothetical protein
MVERPKGYYADYTILKFLNFVTTTDDRHTKKRYTCDIPSKKKIMNIYKEQVVFYFTFYFRFNFHLVSVSPICAYIRNSLYLYLNLNEL